MPPAFLANLVSLCSITLMPFDGGATHESPLCAVSPLYVQCLLNALFLAPWLVLHSKHLLFQGVD